MRVQVVGELEALCKARLENDEQSKGGSGSSSSSPKDSCHRRSTGVGSAALGGGAVGVGWDGSDDPDCMSGKRCVSVFGGWLSELGGCQSCGC